MLKRILTVGGFTFLSRLTGFARDIVLAAILGAGPIADAFFVALRLPNHFRAIFAEGAFNAAFVPSYARIREQQGTGAVKLFADRIFTLMVAIQIVLLALALVFMTGVVDALAPGFVGDATRFPLAVELTRITFPYLMLMTLVTIYSGILNALNRFAAAAAAPILLNLSMMVALALAAFFPTAGHAAAWGVLIAGCLEVLLVAFDASRQGVAAEAALAALRYRGEDLLQAARARDPRLGRNPDRAVCRHHHRELSRRRRALGPLLRGPPQPAADRRDRHCGRHRAAAGNGEPAGGGRRARRAPRAERGRSSSRSCCRFPAWWRSCSCPI